MHALEKGFNKDVVLKMLNDQLDEPDKQLFDKMLYDKDPKRRK